MIEATLPSNNYNLFFNGIAYSTAKNTYYETKRCVQLNSDAFKSDGAGGYKFSFTEDMMYGRYFLYKNKETSCGYAQINLAYPNVPINFGFKGNINLKNKHYNLSYGLDFMDPTFVFSAPAFASDPTDLTFTLNHAINTCSGTNSALFNDVILTTELCNYTQNPLYTSCNFYPSATLAGISTYAPLKAKGLINCPKGNYVVPPTISLTVWQLGCKGDANNTLENSTLPINAILSIIGAPLVIWMLARKSG
jgi:hypothetical protein